MNLTLFIITYIIIKRLLGGKLWIILHRKKRRQNEVSRSDAFQKLCEEGCINRCNQFINNLSFTIRKFILISYTNE